MSRHMMIAIAVALVACGEVVEVPVAQNPPPGSAARTDPRPPVPQESAGEGSGGDREMVIAATRAALQPDWARLTAPKPEAGDWLTPQAIFQAIPDAKVLRPDPRWDPINEVLRPEAQWDRIELAKARKALGGQNHEGARFRCPVVLTEATVVRANEDATLDIDIGFQHAFFTINVLFGFEPGIPCRGGGALSLEHETGGALFPVVASDVVGDLAHLRGIPEDAARRIVSLAKAGASAIELKKARITFEYYIAANNPDSDAEAFYPVQKALAEAGSPPEGVLPAWAWLQGNVRSNRLDGESSLEGPLHMILTLYDVTLIPTGHLWEILDDELFRQSAASAERLRGYLDLEDVYPLRHAAEARELLKKLAK